MDFRLGELLIRAKATGRGDVRRALEVQARSGGRLASILVALGCLDPDQAVYHLCRQLRSFPVLDAELDEIPPEALEQVPAELAARYRVLPYRFEKRRLSLAMVDPLDAAAVRAIEFAGQCSVEPRCSYEMAVLEGVDRRYGLSLGQRYREIRRIVSGK